MPESKEVLKKLKGKLAGLEDTLSRLFICITDVFSGAILYDRDEIQIRKAFLEANYETYKATYLQIHEDGTQDENYIALENNYISALAKINKLLSKSNKNTENISAAQSPPTQEAHSQVRLPNVTIPKFSGNISEWNTFFDLFRALIDRDANLTDVQKLYYLRAYLEREPSYLIEGLPLVNSSYENAISILKERYDNRKAIINSHLKTILHLKPITKPTSESFREFSVTVKQYITSLKSLNLPVESWDVILVYILSNKLDYNTHKAFELEHSSSKEYPSIKNFLNFLDTRALALENVNTHLPTKSTVTKQTSPKSNSYNFLTRRESGSPSVNNFSSTKRDTRLSKTVLSQTSTNRCTMCKGSCTRIFFCSQFKSLTVPDRRQFVSENKLCFNCLSPLHSVINCSSKASCRVCDKRHHSMLHLEESAPANTSQPVPSTSSATYHNYTSCSQILLATAIVRVSVSNGPVKVARAILDSGSQTHFITENMAKRLGACYLSKNLQIQGIDNKETNITKFVQLRLSSCHSSYTKQLQCAVLNQITAVMPQQLVDASTFKIPSNIQLADPNFGVPGAVDLLLGADLFYEIINPGNYFLGPQLPLLQNTKLGWVVTGPAPIKLPNNQQTTSHTANMHVATNLFALSNQSDPIDDLLTKFWAVEEITSIDRSAIDKEVDCKLLSSLKLIENRFQTNLLFRNNSIQHELGNSYLTALSRFRWLERKLSANTELQHAYSDFINEFVSTGHARYIKFKFDPTKGADYNGYFLPHHPVIKPSSTTTKLRVVFDASAKSDSGVSLNDTQLIGCPVQAELFDILIRFRTYRYAFSCDIEKMYRQILVDPTHRKYQRIIWRQSPHLPLRHLELNRVTYGVSFAPFIATRILTHIASIVEHNHPEVSQLLRQNTYVDDILAGHDDLKTALILRKNVTEVLKTYSFPLRKFCANASSLLVDLDPSDLESVSLTISDDHYTIKTLGLRWDPFEDNFLISVPTSQNTTLTKRSLLSFIAGIFDPLGLIAPVTVTAKLFMQQLWSEKLDWDSPIPNTMTKTWLKFTNTIHTLNNLTIPRWIFQDAPTEIELHAFCDASKAAYGACIYIRAKTNNSWHTRLLCAKSRVAPLKALTMPRLELQAALLLSKLVFRCLSLLTFNLTRVSLWTDSMIVLEWLKSSPHKLEPAVGFRISQIHELTKSCTWNHIQSKQNPADILSRGAYPEQLSSLALWWNGPDNFTFTSSQLKLPKLELSYLSTDNENSAKIISVSNDWNQWFKRFSNLNRLLHSVAYMFRFVQTTRHQTMHNSLQLSIKEIENATMFVIRQVQDFVFSKEISQLKTKKPVTTSLRDLFPFVDGNDLLRVGGRLSQAHIRYDAKHPLILPSHHHVTSLFFLYEHHRLLHASPTVTLHNMRQQYWPLGGRREAKRVLSSCLQCFKTRKTVSTQLMGSLPEERLTAVRPFHTVGVDFAGPVDIKQSRLRKALLTKGYIAVFVCLVTHCIHIELVSALTTEAFLMCLDRFIARRGRPTLVLSDNAKNFHGTSNKLRNLRDLFLSQQHQAEVMSFATKNRITWNFIPPRSPNFGGMWEAGVKSVKSHLNRVLQNRSLTYEEFYTVLTQIEAVLNSRPLASFSDDPRDFNVLTLGHFLIHDNPSSYPRPVETNVPENRLSFWRQCQQLADHFWQKWHLEVLNRYQQRNKWKTSQNNVKVDELVLLKDTNLPPFLWKTGRITETFPGRDGLVRTVKVRTPEGEYVRTISHIVPFPNLS